MGYKTHKAKRLVGSLQDTWLKYVMTADIEINPKDTYGHVTANHLVRTMSTLDARLLQPEFQFTYKLMSPAVYESFIKLKFVNTHVQVYNLNRFPWGITLKHLEYLNHYFDIEETLKGREIDYEDEMIIK
mmetsp:Transcript_26585/g.30712  ORF Transcript_26585/g.30712 Transcript_26585/m.30712 type:complete len:130 (-) Transcript_26585:30-419(-)